MGSFSFCLGFSVPRHLCAGVLTPRLNRNRGLLSACLLQTLAREEIVHPDLECSQGLRDLLLIHQKLPIEPLSPSGTDAAWYLREL